MTEMEYMRQEQISQLWIDTRLNEEVMSYLNDLRCSNPTEQKKDWRKNLAGNLSKSELIVEDKDNWFYETVLKKLTERMFYRNWDVYYKYHVEKEEPPPKFELDRLWVNYQKQHEFNPPHYHGGLFSFVIFVKIPTHWKEQHALPFSCTSRKPLASDFQFVWFQWDLNEIVVQNIPLSPEDEGRMLFFPAYLQHQVFPFYECEEDRVTISGNIRLYEPNKPEKTATETDYYGVTYEEKKKTLKIWEEGVKLMKEEMKQMEKEKSI